MPEVIVQKPQFDTVVLSPGTALFVKSNRDREQFYNFFQRCLIVKSEPLALKLAYVKAHGKRGLDEDEEADAYIDYKTLPVSLVAEGVVEIEVLERKV